MRGSPTIVAPRKVAHKDGFAERPWDKSVELSGVEYDFGSQTRAPWRGIIAAWASALTDDDLRLKS